MGKESAKNISISIKDPKLLDQVKKVSKKVGIKEREMIRKFIEIGLEEMAIFNNIGYLKLALVLKKVKEVYANSQNDKTSKKDRTKNKPKPLKKSNPFTIRLESDLIKKLDYFHRVLEFESRSDLVEHLIKLNMRDIFYFEKTGILSLSIYLRDCWRKLFEETIEITETGVVKLNHN